MPKTIVPCTKCEVGYKTLDLNRQKNMFALAKKGGADFLVSPCKTQKTGAVLHVRLLVNHIWYMVFNLNLNFDIHKKTLGYTKLNCQ